ncbi:MAG: DNA ligase (ATP) [Chrysothrix sp. TS-e1954]|nr:MAG: DNA ligase (ATP) [Chrysothrix sp. TS-e1954]
MADDVDMQDGDDFSTATQPQPVANGSQELDEKYPHRPRNHSPTLPFHDLFLTLFNPLNENKKRPSGPAVARTKQGPHGPNALNPHEVRRTIIERFAARWRKQVGDDFFPAMRLILPEKDRERGMYGLKEKAIGKILVKILKINKDSQDGFNLLNWKLPGQKTSSSMVGDFAGRCYEVLCKRPLRTEVGNMTIEEVNERLDRLSSVQGEEAQRKIFEQFYNRMNAEELMWLIRITLRQMKIGATEKTVLEVWHPDADVLFNISSSLRRVCWELYDPAVRLEGEETDITLMQCFQPQLAQFQQHDFARTVKKMRPIDGDDAFWIEEKLDGERMQLHMCEDESHPGGTRFCFWSRKAKDYTYLYGSGFEDNNSALTRHLKSAFADGVRNIILDGEMITWDMQLDKIVGFGTLKTAAIAQKANPFDDGARPLYRVFDILYLNDKALTKFTLTDRRRALEASVKSVRRRMEIHTYKIARSPDEIEPMLRQVVAEASEGLVLKNPRSMYRLNQRNDDWMKVKPEYMTDFGESFDCIVIGGYFGSGHRGGNISSLLCGLRVDQQHVERGADPMKCWSFFKVGGGFAAADYATIRHQTEGKWHDWDAKNPPSKYIELGGGDRQYERPDVWIRPDESFVISVKAASIHTTDQFRMQLTLRFPRFKRIRPDRDWTSALSVAGFIELKNNVEKEQQDKKFTVDAGRKKRATVSRKKQIVVAGASDPSLTSQPTDAGSTNDLFSNLNLFIITESLHPTKKSKQDLQQYAKAHGARLYQSEHAAKNMICIADRTPVAVASIQKRGDSSIVRPAWLFDCVRQAEHDISQGRQAVLLPWEPRHLLFVAEKDKKRVALGADEWADGFARDVGSVEEMRRLLDDMPSEFEEPADPEAIRARIQSIGHDPANSRGSLFKDLTIYIDSPPSSSTSSKAPHDLTTDHILASNLVRFGLGRVSTSLSDQNITHIVACDAEANPGRLCKLRETTMHRPRLPRLVGFEWIRRSWEERTLLDEGRFALG